MNLSIRLLLATVCCLVIASLSAQSRVVVVPLGDTAPSCPEPFLQCSDACVDSQVDESHCGACENACAQGELCSSGTCAISCPTGQMNCSGQCSNTDTDVLNCGGCADDRGTVCTPGQICSRGSCVDPSGG